MRTLRALNGMRAQLLIPLLVALVLAQILSLSLFYNERRLAVRAALGSEVAGRVANVVQLLEAAPADLHSSILRSAESPFVRLSLRDQASVTDFETRPMPKVATSIRDLLDDDNRVIFISIAPAQILRRDHPMTETGPEWMRDVHRRHHGSPLGRPMELSLSVELSDGRWLEVETMFHRPPLQVAWPSFVAMVLMAGATVAIVMWAVHRISRPMKALTLAAERLGRGDDPVTIPLGGPSELRKVTAAFNVMQERLTRHVRERTQMLAALGHDLRSPLTAMRLRLEMVADQETRERLSSTVDEMQTMVETTLAFAKGIAADEPSTDVDLRKLIVEIISDAAQQERIFLSPGASPFVVGKLTALKRALRNIIENAVTYGGQAHVKVERSENAVQITVRDEGTGLSEEDMERVFDPYFRVETSRNRDTGGIGLGLSIAQAVILAHGGEISMQNHSNGGLIVRVLIPDAGKSLA